MKAGSMRSSIVLLGACAVVGCESLEPSNTDLQLRVEADISPRVVSLRDSAAVLHIRVTITNPSDHDIIVPTGGPPYRIATDPEESTGLGPSIRIASPTEPLNGGPSADWWGTPVDTILAGRGIYAPHEVSLAAWRAGGWELKPGRYRVRGYYNGREGVSAPFTVLP
jgi:hypothetical protein